MQLNEIPRPSQPVEAPPYRAVRVLTEHLSYPVHTDSKYHEVIEVFEGSSLRMIIPVSTLAYYLSLEGVQKLTSGQCADFKLKVGTYRDR